MKARSVTFGALLACGLMVAGQGVASANMTWCLSDPPIQVLSPGGHYLVVNNLVYLPRSALHLKNQIYDDAARTFGKDKAKKGYKAAQQQVFGSDASALGADVAGRLPKV